MTRPSAIASVLFAALVLVACSKRPADTTPVAAADLIVLGGPIVTMQGDQPTTVEAIVVDEGKITFVGNKADALKQKAEGTVVKDLGGKTLMPGFIDGHAHAQQFGTQAVGANLLAPPDGAVNTVDDLVARLKTFAVGPDVALTGWIFGMGYDDALLGRHPTRADLDKVSTTVPVMATHISGHFAAVNTLGLQMIGYDAGTANPEGGVIRREADGKTPNGVLEELAAMPYMVKFLAPTTQAGKDYFLKRGLELAKSYGYTTANEGRMFGPMHDVMADAAGRGLVDIDFIGWMDYTGRSALDTGISANVLEPLSARRTEDHSRRLAAGTHGVAHRPLPDPARRPATWLQGLPRNPGHEAGRGVSRRGLHQGLAGQGPRQRRRRHRPAVRGAEARGREARRQAGPGNADPRPVHPPGPGAGAEVPRHLPVAVPDAHVLLGRLVQADRRPGTGCTDFADALDPEHGPARDQPHRRAGGATEPDAGGVGHGESHVPVGHGIGPDERVTPYEAMKMITLWGAEQFGEQATKGSLEAGKLADLVVLSANPLTVDPMTINQIQVLETIKEGKLVWARK